MIFSETRLAGAYLIDVEPIEDERGFNARAWCAREFRDHGLNASPVQSNIIHNRRAGTLRGLHYQRPPHAESKLFRCIRGSIYDVIVDLRTDSPTHGEWFGVQLTAESRRMLYVPEGFAQGFITLEDDTELQYQVSEFYTPASEAGFRFDDPAFGIEWPVPVLVLSQKDQNWPSYRANEQSPNRLGKDAL